MSNPKPNGPDFSQVDSVEKAIKLFNDGLLEKFYLRPLRFGGEDSPLNVVYVPVGVTGDAYEMMGNTIAALVQSGTVSRISTDVEYIKAKA